MRWRFAGSLKGMSLKEYTAVTRFKASTIVARASKYVARNLWLKFDRRKPMSEDQIALVRQAINKAMLELVANYPFEIPIFKLTSKPVVGYKNKSIYFLSFLDLMVLPSVSTDYGAAYKVRKSHYEHGGRSGPITFSRHAIERLFERAVGLKEVCQNECAWTFLYLLQDITLKPEVNHQSMMLSCGDRGHFPIIWEANKKIWVCTTFLLPGFDGTPEHLSESVSRLREKFR